jgi:CheY-like chemotaxis protein
MSAPRVNFSGVPTLVADPDRAFVGILKQMLRGMGFNHVTTVESGAAAQELLAKRVFDFCIFEAVLPELSGAALVSWLRNQPPPRRYTPIIIFTGYSFKGNIASLRDAGANIIVKKPASPAVLFDRIVWAASGTRPFVEDAAYVGPTRRFKFAGLPGDVGRRSTDLPPQIGEAVEPNMSQEEIDALMRPTRISAE